MLFSCAALADASAVVIFAKTNGAPKHFQDAEGNGSGYAIDIARAVVATAGFVPDMVNRPWQRAQLEALQGRGVITSFSLTPERKKDYLFSEPLYADEVVLVSHKDKPIQFEGFSDLRTFVIGISRGSRYGGGFATSQD